MNKNHIITTTSTLPKPIRMSNALIQSARYALSVIEHKILLAAISQIDPTLPADPRIVYTIPFAYFAHLAQVDMTDTTYLRHLDDRINTLMHRSLLVSNSNCPIQWITGGCVDRVNHQIKIQLSADILPYLTQLKSNYTTYNDAALYTMQSIYAIRLYMILMSYDQDLAGNGCANGARFSAVTPQMLKKYPGYANYRYKILGISRLQEMLSSTDNNTTPLKTTYANYSDFDRFVLRRAAEEINDKMDIVVDYLPYKSRGSRKYTHLCIFLKSANNKSKGQQPAPKKHTTRNTGPQQVCIEDLLTVKATTATMPDAAGPIRYNPASLTHQTDAIDRSGYPRTITDLLQAAAITKSADPDASLCLWQRALKFASNDCRVVNKNLADAINNIIDVLDQHKDNAAAMHNIATVETVVHGMIAAVYVLRSQCHIF